jgi:hypothetical protein
MDDLPKSTEIVTYRIPRIEVYPVTDDEMCRIEEGCGRVSEDFAFAMSFLSFGVAFLIALMTATFSETRRIVFVIIVVVCGIGFLYTGVRWLMQKEKVPEVIAKIRSRKTEPEVPPAAQP